MMTTSDYQKKRDVLLARQEPYRVFSKEEVFAQADNLYQVSGTTFEVSDYVQMELDNLIGLHSRQREGIRDAYGEQSLADFRNSLAMASCVVKPKRFALLANTKEHIVDGVIPLENDAIPMESFFQVLEMFADKNGFEVSSLQTAGNANMGAVAHLYPIYPEFDVFFENDEFMKNGFYMRWNLGGIEIGNYIERLVCANGATEIREHRLNAISRLDDSTIKDFIADPSHSQICINNINRIKEHAFISRNASASLNELCQAQKLLQRNGIEDGQVEYITGVKATLELCNQAGW